MKPVIRLGWSQFAVMTAALLAMLVAVWLFSPIGWDDLYARKFGLPRIQQRYGFEFGTVTFQHQGITYSWPGIVSVSPSGEFAKFGLRSRDLVWDRHGHSAALLYARLTASERGEAVEFDVVNADVLFTSIETFRTIRIPPRPR